MLALDYRVPKEVWAREAGQRNGLSRGQTVQAPENKVEDAGVWEPAVQKIVTFQNLDEDWDGLGALAPSRELLISAIGLAYLFSGSGMPPPSCVVPGRDGSVNFEWQDPDGTIAEVEIDRPYHAEVMVIEPGKSPRFWQLPTE